MRGVSQKTADGSWGLASSWCSTKNYVSQYEAQDKLDAQPMA